MTSKHFLAKYMIEDLRHRLWMLALSVLGSFLCMPVAYLLVMGSYRPSYERYLKEYGLEKARELFQDGLCEYFQKIGLGLNGVIAVCGAVIVGAFRLPLCVPPGHGGHLSQRACEAQNAFLDLLSERFPALVCTLFGLWGYDAYPGGL